MSSHPLPSVLPRDKFSRLVLGRGFLPSWRKGKAHAGGWGRGRTSVGRLDGLDVFLAIKVQSRSSQGTTCARVCVLPSKSPSKLN